MAMANSKYRNVFMGVRKLGAGEAYVAEETVDFTCHPSSCQGVVYRAAQEKGSEWRATTVVIGHRVVYAYYKRGDYMKPNLPAYPVVKKLKGER